MATNERNRIRKCSAKEYYHLCGFNAATRQREKYRRMAKPEIRDLIDGIPSLRTANFDAVKDGIQYRLANLLAITDYFDKDAIFQILRLKSYKGRQRGLNELARRFTFGSKKYGATPRPNHRQVANPEQKRKHPDKWKAICSKDQAQEDATQKYIIAFGAGVFAPMKGKRLGPTKALWRRLCAVSRNQPNVSVLKVCEDMTSQNCATCQARTLINLRERRSANNFGHKVHAVRICKTCGTVWNRDEMAAKDILYIFKYMALNNNVRPPSFVRKAGK
jgi:hypothetical protein